MWAAWEEKHFLNGAISFSGLSAGKGKNLDFGVFMYTHAGTDRSTIIRSEYFCLSLQDE